ncbi:MAG: hypothetical protein HZB91_06720 [Elusimicrobia bacterium]|nr:hypothetical protein [Elusimicrobiota bacterium]
MPEILVVISHYDARPARALGELLASMEEHPAGADFSVRIVVNQARERKGPLPATRLPVEILHRPNSGMNIGAWEAGWRAHPDFANYLFLQDECRIERPGWAAAFKAASQASRVGMVGESLNVGWEKPWSRLRRLQEGVELPGHELNGRRANRVDVYLDYLRRCGIEPGATARHLRALVWFMPRSVLEDIDGFPIATSYGECIACEIGVSRKVESMGLAVRQVHAESFRYISHGEWVRDPSGAVRKRTPVERRWG